MAYSVAISSHLMRICFLANVIFNYISHLFCKLSPARLLVLAHVVRHGIDDPQAALALGVVHAIGIGQLRLPVAIPFLVGVVDPRVDLVQLSGRLSHANVLRVKR